jgi:hypothetical protein
MAIFNSYVKSPEGTTIAIENLHFQQANHRIQRAIYTVAMLVFWRVLVCVFSMFFFGDLNLAMQ